MTDPGIHEVHYRVISDRNNRSGGQDCEWHVYSAVNFAEDHFSSHASDYAAHRPTYPSALFDYLASLCPTQDLAWDCATGNGQAAILLADHFASVIATDASAPQVEAATSHPNVRYETAPAEASPLATDSVDLVTVAQAAHWFDLDAFYRETERVLKPSGVLALWCYGLAKVTTRIDALIENFFSETVGSYWPDKRSHIDNGYTFLTFPHNSLSTPRFEMKLTWTVDQCLAYLQIWSAVKRYEAEVGVNPTDALQGPLSSAWGERERSVEWPLTLKVAQPENGLRLPDQA